MDLDEYLWRTRKTAKDFAKEIGIAHGTMIKIKHKRHTPSMLTAIKISIASDCQVSCEQMLCEEKAEKLEKWMSERKALASTNILE